jgi:hypothetical protein
VPTLISPANGAIGISHAATLFAWNESLDPDAGNTVSYRLEYTNDPSLSQWEEAGEVPADTSARLPFALAALAGTVAFVRPGSRRMLLMLLVAAALVSPLSSCGGSDGTIEENQVMNLTATLEPNTEYWWKVTAVDSNGKENTSEVMQFKTRP